MTSNRIDRYCTFRARVRYEAKSPLSNERLIWQKDLFFRAWESSANIASIGCALEQGAILFPKNLECDITSIDVVMLNSPETGRGLYSRIYSWVRKNQADREALYKLSELLGKERRQIKDLQFLRMA